MRSIEWIEGEGESATGSVRFIDQTHLPSEEVTVETADVRVLADALRLLKIRGAPAIGVAAAFGIVLGVQRADSRADLERAFADSERLLSSTRPTAVNLRWALRRMRRVFEDLAHRPPTEARLRLLEEARRVQQEDEKTCRRIGEVGEALVPSRATILTHCNTGALATAGEGTAQAVIAHAARAGKEIRVVVDETRPLLQGARLTTWELQKAGIPVTLITDNVSGFLMQQRRVDLVLVGADRIAANGDVANKIGTYTLAVLADRHGIPFYVAAPLSSIDFEIPSGDRIPIEERDSREVTEGFGKRTAPKDVRVYSPAFDVTPHELVTAIITDVGVLRPPFTASIAEARDRRDSERTG